MTLWLILDVSNLAYRNFHVLPALRFNDVAMAVVFGIFRDILNLQEIHQSDNTVFCFDSRRSARRELFPGYKSNRRKKELTGDERAAHAELHNQVKRLRTKYLPFIGFRNVLVQNGCEADDLIASVCLDNLGKGDRAVVVSTDSDLLQLLGDDQVTIWNPATKKPTNGKSFRKQWGIDPTLWADVKALAGCASDGVPGIEGVGEKTAVKFLSGCLKDTTKAYNGIVEGNDLYRRNLELVRLPFEGTRQFVLRPDEVTDARWDRAFDKLGMVSLKGRL